MRRRGQLRPGGDDSSHDCQVCIMMCLLKYWKHAMQSVLRVCLPSWHIMCTCHALCSQSSDRCMRLQEALHAFIV
jgi:hypothetical protein